MYVAEPAIAYILHTDQTGSWVRVICMEYYGKPAQAHPTKLQTQVAHDHHDAWRS